MTLGVSVVFVFVFAGVLLLLVELLNRVVHFEDVDSDELK